MMQVRMWTRTTTNMMMADTTSKIQHKNDMWHTNETQHTSET